MLAGFLVGVFVGGVFGVFIMAILSYARSGDGDEDDERETDDR